MKKLIVTSLVVLCSHFAVMATTQTIQLRILQTSDVHGCFFHYDFINRRPASGGLSRVYTYIDSLRNTYGRNLILLDNGDILQGQPSCYYYNFIKTKDRNVASDIMNFMHYDAQSMGNHDVETSHAVYDKWMKELKSPTLGANIINTATGTPYLAPYTIIHRQGVKIAVMGLITPAIPNWLNESLWQGLRFDEMVASARHWMQVIQEQEQPDVVIGLFHSGKEGGIKTAQYEENTSLKIAREVDGFDLVLFGHDHAPYCETIKNNAGKDVVCINPGSNAQSVSDAEITITIQQNSDNNQAHQQIISKKIKGQLADVRQIEPNALFTAHFAPQFNEISAFVNRKIGTIANTIYSRDSYFGPAPFTDIIHDLQRELTKSDISFTAPLTFDSKINQGDIHVADLFNLYRYENQIYQVKMTGKEIHDYLEMSYDQWVNTMKSPDDHIMLLSEETMSKSQRRRFQNLTFNFDSATGIDYVVDVTKPKGQRVKIQQLWDGRPFNVEATYTVAMNSYRANGGGELMTRGAGIAPEELKNRIVFQSEKDQRFYLMQWIEQSKTVNPKPHDNWKFVPEEWTTEAIKRDKQLIFGDNK